MRCHGEVPLVLTSVFNVDDISKEPALVRDVYTQIEQDLGEAISRLSDSRRNGEPGRPNKGSALAMLAEVYLSEAGWPLKETDKYKLAASTAKQVLDDRAKYGFDFEDSYAVLFENDETNSGINKEDIFTIPCNKSMVILSMPCMVSGPILRVGWLGCSLSELTFYNEFPKGPRKDATLQQNLLLKTEFTIIGRN